MEEKGRSKKEPNSKRLGALLRRKREEAGMGPVELARKSKVSRSYLNYLEQGRFAEVGLDKFSRIIQALGLSADQVLQEAGYLPLSDWTMPEPRIYLRERLGLPRQAQDQAIAYLEFLGDRSSRKTAKSKGKR